MVGREATGEMSALSNLLLAGAVVAAMLLSVGCTREIREEHLFFPQRVPEVGPEPGRRDVEIPIGEGQSIRGWYFHDAARPTTLIYFYGNGETSHAVHRRARWLVDELAVNVMLVDYRGYGRSDGVPGVEVLLADALRIYDAVPGLSGAPQRVGVFGRSIGTAPAIHLAANRELTALILEAPFTSIDDIVAAWDRGLRGPAGWLFRLKPERRLARLRPQPIDLIGDIAIPLLVIHGDQDTIIPTALGQTLFHAAPEGRKTWIVARGVGHNDLSLAHPDVEPALRTFAADHLDRAENES